MAYYFKWKHQSIEAPNRGLGDLSWEIGPIALAQKK
jgi:hypothetical protein